MSLAATIPGEPCTAIRRARAWMSEAMVGLLPDASSGAVYGPEHWAGARPGCGSVRYALPSSSKRTCESEMRPWTRPLAMEMGHCRCHLLECLVVKRPTFRQRQTTQPGHHYVSVARLPPEVDYWDQVGMGQLGSGGHRTGKRRHERGVVGCLSRQNLDGDLPPDAGLESAVHRPCAAVRDDPTQLVSPDRMNASNGTGSPPGQQVGVLTEHSLVHGSEVGRRVEADVFAQVAAGALERTKRFGLASSQVQRMHQLGSEALPKRVLSREAHELTDDLCAPAEFEVGVDAEPQCREPQVGQPRDLGSKGDRVAHVAICLARPHTEGRAEMTRDLFRIRFRRFDSFDLQLELDGIDRGGVQVERIAVLVAHDGGAELGSKMVDVPLQGLAGGLRRILGPDLVDQAVGPDRSARSRGRATRARVAAACPQAATSRRRELL